MVQEEIAHLRFRTRSPSHDSEEAEYHRGLRRGHHQFLSSPLGAWSPRPALFPTDQAWRRAGTGL